VLNTILPQKATTACLMHIAFFKWRAKKYYKKFYIIYVDFLLNNISVDVKTDSYEESISPINYNVNFCRSGLDESQRSSSRESW
jgi:hypothetical protein